MFIPCKVCGDRSSGIHYGRITCEGCKVNDPNWPDSTYDYGFWKKYFRDSFADHRLTKSTMLVQKVATVLLTREVATGANIVATRNASLLAWVVMVSLLFYGSYFHEHFNQFWPILTNSVYFWPTLTKSDLYSIFSGKIRANDKMPTRTSSRSSWIVSKWNGKET